MANQQSQRHKDIAHQTEGRNLSDLLNSKIPFGMPATRSNNKGLYVGKNSLPNIMP
jgi:hypothetical protein